MELRFREVGMNQEAKESALKGLGIEYRMEFINHIVPCECKLNYVVSPKNDLEKYAAIGLLN